MTIDIIGNHCTWGKPRNTSFIVNNNLIFDIPIGSFKVLFNDYDMKKIDYIVISHFHSDHFGDIFLLLEILFRMNKSITIVAPKTCKQRIEMLMRVMDVSHLIPQLDNIKFIDSENGKTIKLGEYKIKCYSVSHGNLDAYGYVIYDGNVKVGFSGDSCDCNNIRKIAKASKAMFIDSSNVTQDNKHLATYEVKTLAHEFPNTTFYPVHLTNKSEATLDNFGLYKTHEGQKIIVE